MPDVTDAASYTSDDTALLREIAGGAETRLQAQLTAALAADQRALVLAGFLSAAIVALVGGSVALWLSEPRQEYLSQVGLLCAFGFLVSFIIATFTARPVKWAYPGTRPELWIKDIDAGKSEAARLAELCADLQTKIEDNATIMAINGWLIRIALMVAGVSLIGGAVALMRFF